MVSMLNTVLWARMAAAIVFVCALPALSAGQQITEIDASPLGGTSATPYDINSVGQVTGSYVTGGGVSHAFIWTTSGMLDIESDPNATSYGLLNVRCAFSPPLALPSSRG